MAPATRNLYLCVQGIQHRYQPHRTPPPASTFDNQYVKQNRGHRKLHVHHHAISFCGAKFVNCKFVFESQVLAEKKAKPKPNRTKKKSWKKRIEMNYESIRCCSLSFRSVLFSPFFSLSFFRTTKTTTFFASAIIYECFHKPSTQCNVRKQHKRCASGPPQKYNCVPLVWFFQIQRFFLHLKTNLSWAGHCFNRFAENAKKEVNLF